TFFFFQAEDGIRDFHVTGVQTCALPIYSSANRNGEKARAAMAGCLPRMAAPAGILQLCSTHRSTGRRRSPAWDRRRTGTAGSDRSEERRVGEEGGRGWWQWRSRERRGEG